MGGPRALLYAMSALVLVTSAYCLSRLVVARLRRRLMHYDLNVAHVTMGVAMAGMFVGSFRTLPPVGWELVFGALTGWFALRVGRFVRAYGFAGRDGAKGLDVTHYASHLVMALAMVYMLVAGGSAAEMGGSAAGSFGNPTGAGAMAAAPGGLRSGLPLLFLVVLIVSAVWHADGLSRFPAASRGSCLAPRLEIACHVAMCIAMGYMLVLLH